MILRKWRNCICFPHQRPHRDWAGMPMWREGSPVLYTPSLTHGNLWISSLHNCLTQGIIQKKNDPEKNRRALFLSSHPTISLCCFPNSDSICTSTQRAQPESLNLLQNRCILIKWRFPPLEVDGFEFPVGTAWKRNYTFSNAVWYTVLTLDFMFFLDHKIKVALLYSVHVSCV